MAEPRQHEFDIRTAPGETAGMRSLVNVGRGSTPVVTFAPRIGLVLLCAAGCPPPAGKAAPVAAIATPALPAPAAGHPGRIAIAGPEATRVSYALLGRQPPLGARQPKAIQYSPD